jgi:large subunit ribosomal protein L21
MNYAIVEISGKQMWVEKGKFYDINKVNMDIGSKIQLNRILLINKDNQILLGSPYIENTYVTVTILKHFKGSKIIIYKMKPKKKMQRKYGFRKNMTRILIDSVVLP